MRQLLERLSGPATALDKMADSADAARGHAGRAHAQVAEIDGADLRKALAGLPAKSRAAQMAQDLLEDFDTVARDTRKAFEATDWLTKRLLEIIREEKRD